VLLVGLLNTLRGLDHRHLLCHRDRISRRIGPAVAELAAVAHLRGYVELLRNLPVLFQILFWYLAVLAALPNPRQSIALFGKLLSLNRGFVIPKPIGTAGFEPFAVAVLIGIVASLLWWRYARRQLFESGR